MQTLKLQLKNSIEITTVFLLLITPFVSSYCYYPATTKTTTTTTTQMNTASRFLSRSSTSRLLGLTSTSTSMSTSMSRSRLQQQTRLFAYSTRKMRKEVAKNQGKNAKELDWEHYEFSQNPKNDNRFNELSQQQEEFDIEKETEDDQKVAKELDDKHNAIMNLSPKDVEDATKALESIINNDRLERVRTVLGQRTKNCKFLFENPNNPSNVWACLRTIDSFGIQDVDLVIESGIYQGKQSLSTKRGMRTAMGSAQWLSLRNHPSTPEAIKQIRDVQGYKIYASDLNPNSKDIRDIDWEDGPYCIVMGNEDRGISEEMRNLADETFTLPMCGFAESFNLSVATSITLAHMSAKSQNGKGPLLPGDMDEHEYNCLYLRGLFHSVPQFRTGQAMLKQNNLTEVLKVYNLGL